MPRPAPAHHLGPQSVGRRVVVRRVLPGLTGPSGGPAMTDLLGVCIAWADGACVVQPEHGPAVTIDLADIVSGKPVPPRPSPRLRISADAAQRHGMALFPDLETQPLSAWTLRHSPTLGARRANSVLAVAAPDSVEALGAAHDEVVDWYVARHRRPIAAVQRDTEAERMFLSHGWVPESADADTVFQLTSVAALARRGPALVEPVHLAGDDAVVTATVGEGLASGVAVLDDDWVGFRGVVVDPTRRRQGLGRSVMGALVEWAAERGATTAYLQVLSQNEAALRLYAGLGFAEHHRYRYLAAP